jgi:hypothetical protein
MSTPERSKMTIRRLVIGTVLGLTILSLLLQMIIDPALENIASACLVAASSMSILAYIGWTRALDIQPLSTFSIFGFCATTQLGALLAQTAAWTALRNSLYDPVYTFGTLAMYQAIALAVHAAYTFLFKAKHSAISPIRWVLNRAGLYRRPDAAILWMMGAVGLASFALSGNKGVIGKVAVAFNFLTWAPFLIPMYLAEVGDSYCNARRATPLLALYTLAICLLGVAVNARGIIFLGVITIGLCYLLIALRSTAPVRVRGATLLKISVLGAVALALAGPISDLATAMAIARAHRGKVSALEMMANTLDAWKQPYLIAQFRAIDQAATRKVYDETYIANPLIARFVETKFHDNSLHFAALLTTEDSKARLGNVTAAMVWAVLPTPILRALHISVNKTDLEFSMGDYIFYLSRGIPLGGHLTGSIFAEGITLFGPLFPFLYAGICVVSFVLMDLMTVRGQDGLAWTSAVAKMQAWVFFIYGITAESISAMFAALVRDWIQVMLVYLIVLAVASLILHRPRAPSIDSGALHGGRGQ